MKRPKDRRIWVAGMATAFVIWGTLFFLQTDAAAAIFEWQRSVATAAYEALDFDTPDYFTAGGTPVSVLPATEVTQPQMPTSIAAVTPTLDLFPEMVCASGPDPDCLIEPLFVPGSDDRWAYDIVDGVYFEYSSDWRVELSQNPLNSTRYFVSAADSFENLYVKGTYITVRNDALSNDLPPREDALWSQQISLPDFEGYEFLTNDPDLSRYYLHVSLYNKDQKKMIYSAMVIDNDPDGQWTTTPQTAQESFPNFHHMIHSLKIWHATGFAIPTATATETLPPSP
jgi:hypothetical protein